MNVARLFAVNAFIRVAAAAFGQLFAFALADRLHQRVGTGAGLVSLLGASFYLTELIGAPMAGRLADVHGQRRVMRLGPMFGAICGLLGALSVASDLALWPLAVLLLFARTTEGLSAACAVPTTLVLLSRATRGHAVRRTRLVAIFEITSLVSMIIGYGVAGFVWDSLRWRSFLLFAAFYGAAWILVGSEDGPARAASTAGSQRRSVVHLAMTLARDPGYLAFGLAWLSVNAVVGAWLQQLPYLLKLPERSATQALVGGFTGREIGFIFGAYGATFLVGIALWSIFGARIERRRVLSISLIGMIGVAIFLALRNRGLGSWTLVLATLCVLVESGFTPAALAHLADATDRHDESRGAALGLYSLLLAAGQLLGNALSAPFAIRWQMDGVLLLTALLGFAASLAVHRMGAHGALESSEESRTRSSR